MSREKCETERVKFKWVHCDNCGERCGTSTAKIPTGVICVRCTQLEELWVVGK